MNKVRWGIMGTGFIVRDWMIPAFRKMGGTVESILSSSAERAKEFAFHHHIPVGTDDLDSFLTCDIDAVYVATTNELHVPQALAAIRAGKHVLCEKPLATDYKGAKEMVDAARQVGLVFATNHHLRCSGSHLAMRDALQAGKIGRPLFAKVAHARYLPEFLQSWRLTHPEKGAGVILDITTHDVDSLRFILRCNPKNVACMSQSGVLTKGKGETKEPVEDGAMTLIEFENGILAQTHDAFTAKFGTTGIKIHGEQGSLIATHCMNQDPDGEVVLRTNQGEEELVIERHNPYERTIAAFGRAINGSGEPAATGVDGLWSLATGLAAVESARTGKNISIHI